MTETSESCPTDVLAKLEQLIESNLEPTELKRALAIQMLIQGLKTTQIPKILGVSAPFISKWKVRYALEGIERLKLKYQGSKGYLSQRDCQEIIAWLHSKNQIHLSELENHIENHYGVTFKSKQSYYDLLKEARMSWKKTQKKIPNEMRNWWKNDIKKSAVY